MGGWDQEEELRRLKSDVRAREAAEAERQRELEAVIQDKESLQLREQQRQLEIKVLSCPALPCPALPCPALPAVLSFPAPPIELEVTSVPPFPAQRKVMTCPALTSPHLDST